MHPARRHPSPLTRLKNSGGRASSDALPHPHARLASGWWLAFTGWESNPLDSIEKFLPVTSNFLLSQVYPGATKSAGSRTRVFSGDFGVWLRKRLI